MSVGANPIPKADYGLQSVNVFVVVDWECCMQIEGSMFHRLMLVAIVVR